MTSADATMTADAPNSVDAAAPAPAPTLPRLRTALAPDQVRQRLDAAARKGRLPGLKADAPDVLFEVRELGHPFESTLRAVTDPDGAISFSLRMKRTLPAVFAVILVVSIWPGIYLVDSMLRQYFSWYAPVQTWWWYLPLTVPTSPWAFWSAVKRSRAAALEHAAESVQKIAAELQADVL